MSRYATIKKFKKIGLMQKKYYVLIIFLVFMVSCSGIKFVKITSENKDKEEGLRFYRPDPYLLVTKGTDTVTYYSILWLPNKKEEYAMQLKSGLGSNDVKIKLENGWLVTEFSANVDPKVPELVTAATAPLAGIIGAAKEVVGKEVGEKVALPPTLAPGLYKFTFDPKGYIDGVERINLKNKTNDSNRQSQPK